MAKNDRKRSFKTKVITKLFGQAEEDYSDGQDSDFTEENISAPSISVAPLSDYGHEEHNNDIVVYGVYHVRGEAKQEKYINEPTPNVGPATHSSDDEGSESDVIQKKRRRRGRRGHSKSAKKEQNETLLSNDSTQTESTSCDTNDILPMNHVNLTANQKRKIKKKRREKEKRARSCHNVEFTFDSNKSTCG